MAKTQAQLAEEIKSVYEQIEEYKRKYHEEVELKREREEELRKKGEGQGAGTLASSASGSSSSSTTTTTSAAVAPASWLPAVRLGGSPSVSSTSSPSSSTSTTPHASNDSVPTRRPLSKNEEELKKDKKDKKDRKEKKEKKKHNRSLTRHQSSDAVPTTAAPSLPIGIEGGAAAAATAAAEKTFTVRSLQAHKATSKNELSFAKGVIITVIEENKADDLFKGQIGKKEGWFPSFYVVRT